MTYTDKFEFTSRRPATADDVRALLELVLGAQSSNWETEWDLWSKHESATGHTRADLDRDLPSFTENPTRFRVVARRPYGTKDSDQSQLEVDAAEWSADVELKSLDREWSRRQGLLLRSEVRARFPGRRLPRLVVWPLAIVLAIVAILLVILLFRWFAQKNGLTVDLSGLTVTLSTGAGFLVWKITEALEGPNGVRFLIVPSDAKRPWFERDFVKGMLAGAGLLGGIWTAIQIVQQLLR